MQAALLPLLTFLAVAMGVTAVFSLLSDLFLRDRERVQDRLDVEFHNKQREKVKRSLLYKESDPFQVEALAGTKPPRLTWSEWLQVLIDQSGLEMTQTRFLILTGVSAASCGLVLGLLLRSPLFGLAGAAVGGLGPCSTSGSSVTSGWRPCAGNFRMPST